MPGEARFLSTRFGIPEAHHPVRAGGGDQPAVRGERDSDGKVLVLGGRDVDAGTAALLAALDRRGAPTVLVSNEVGLGVVPDNALSRRFRDAAGVLHQAVAARADDVVLVVAGLAVRVK